MDIKKELLENNIIMVVVPNDKYTKSVLELVKQLSEFDKGTCYVNLNQMSDLLIKYFKKNEVNCDKLLFVDMITRTVQSKPLAIDNVIFVSDPSALTEMVILINKILKRDKMGFLFFDSISTLLLYRNQKIIIKGVRDVIAKIKKSGNKGILIALETDVSRGKFKGVGPYIDKIVYLGKEPKGEEKKPGRKV